MNQYVTMILFVFLLVVTTMANTKELEMLDMWYSEDVTRVEVGETITWKPTVGGKFGF